jgi:arsenical pump membrane protein
MLYNIDVWVIAMVSILLIIIRPFKLSEAYWAIAGALALLIFKFITPAEALSGISKGLDVYLFLAGMMLLAEVAREERLFDWLAAQAVSFSKGSSKKLFLLVYIVGAFTTALLSNDATAVVLTPAVFAATRAAKVENPLPYLLICAFIANAASFVLPISNPANLVIYGKNMPPLLSWLRQYIIPSLLSITITCIALYFTQRHAIKAGMKTGITVPKLSAGGRLAAFGILASAIVLLVCSALDIRLGLPTAITGVVICIIISQFHQLKPLKVLSQISWSVIPLVAGLFVIVEALDKTGLLYYVKNWLGQNTQQSVATTTWGSGIGIAFISNLVNNLPSGLIAGNAVQAASVPEIVHRSILVGVDLGPNLSVTGSLATILWLVVLRKERQDINAWQFLKMGFVVMLPALLATIASLWI